MSPKQRNPFLFRNNSNEISQGQDLDRRIQNMERAPINVQNKITNIRIEKPRKPFNPMIPVNGPVGGSSNFPIIFMTSKAGVAEHKFYTIDGASNELALISTQTFGGIIFPNYGSTLRRLGNSYYMATTSSPFDGNRIRRSQDGCVTWETVLETGSDTIAFCMDAGGRIWVAAWDYEGLDSFMSMWHSDDDGDTWTKQSEVFSAGGGIDAFSMDAHPTDENIIIATGFFYADGSIGVLRSTDRGQNWTASSIAGTETQYSSFEIKNCMFLSDGRFIIVDANLNGGVPYTVDAYRSDNSGASFATSIIQTDNSGQTGSDFFNPVMSLHGEGEKLYACFGETHEFGNEANSGKIYESLDRGESWSEVTHWPAALNWEDINSIFYDSENDKLILLTTGPFDPVDATRGQLFVSSPPGSNWTNITPEANLQDSGAAFMTIVR